MTIGAERDRQTTKGQTKWQSKSIYCMQKKQNDVFCLLGPLNRKWQFQRIKFHHFHQFIIEGHHLNYPEMYTAWYYKWLWWRIWCSFCFPISITLTGLYHKLIALAKVPKQNTIYLHLFFLFIYLQDSGIYLIQLQQTARWQQQCAQTVRDMFVDKFKLLWIISFCFNLLSSPEAGCVWTLS